MEGQNQASGKPFVDKELLKKSVKTKEKMNGKIVKKKTDKNED